MLLIYNIMTEISNMLFFKILPIWEYWLNQKWKNKNKNKSRFRNINPRLLDGPQQTWSTDKWERNYNFPTKISLHQKSIFWWEFGKNKTRLHRVLIQKIGFFSTCYPIMLQACSHKNIYYSSCTYLGLAILLTSVALEHYSYLGRSALSCGTLTSNAPLVMLSSPTLKHR